MKVLRGPYRSYLPPTTYFATLVGTINNFDRIASFVLAIAFLARQHTKLDKLREPTSSETEILQAIDHYNAREFSLMTFPPLGVQLLFLFTKLTGGVSIEVLRRVSVFLGSITISCVYLTLRKSKVSSVLSLAVSFTLSHLPLFEDEVRSVSLNSLELLFLSCSLFYWKSFKCPKTITASSFYNLAFLSLFLGCAMTTKYIGLVTWLWVIVLTLKQMWGIIGDLQLTNRDILKHGALRFATLVIGPLIVFLTSYYCHLAHLNNHSQEFSSLMSPYFKATLLPEGFPPPDTVYYGSNVLIRHYESLGGYLHSHNYTYKSGSQEQQVTLYDYANDADNEWIIEPESEEQDSSKGTSKEPVPVKNREYIKLRHRVTGKLLRASSAKPPISEQDYDKEVACTGDADYKGNSDELWRIKFIRGKTGYRESLSPVTIEFQLVNKGQGCTLLSHDLKLPDWAFEQQEVLCVDPPTLGRTLFVIERSNLYLNPGAILKYPKELPVIKFGKLLVEYIHKQIKYDYYMKNHKQKGDVPVEHWLWSAFDSKLVNFMWFCPIACLIIYIFVELYEWATWNPWNSQDQEVTLNNMVYRENCFQFFLGWFLHYYIFTKSKHENLNLAQYLPSYLFSLLLTAHTLNSVWGYGKISRIALAFSLLLVVVICITQ